MHHFKPKGLQVMGQPARGCKVVAFRCRCRVRLHQGKLEIRGKQHLGEHGKPSTSPAHQRKRRDCNVFGGPSSLGISAKFAASSRDERWGSPRWIRGHSASGQHALASNAPLRTWSAVSDLHAAIAGATASMTSGAKSGHLGSPGGVLSPQGLAMLSTTVKSRTTAVLDSR